MTDEQLQALQEEIMQTTIEAPAEMEALIKDTAQKAARDMAFKSSQTSQIEFNDEVFTLKATKKVVGFKEVIFMVVVNENHRKMGGSKYRPFTVTAHIDNAFSYQENIEAVVETFLRHISGLGEQAQELGEDE